MITGLVRVIPGDSEHSAKFPKVVKMFLERVKSLWLNFVTLKSSDKAVELFSNSNSSDVKAVLFNAVNKVCFCFM